MQSKWPSDFVFSVCFWLKALILLLGFFLFNSGTQIWGCPSKLKPVRLLFCPHKLNLQDLISLSVPFRYRSGRAPFSELSEGPLDSGWHSVLPHYAPRVYSPRALGNPCRKWPLHSIGQSVCLQSPFVTDNPTDPIIYISLEPLLIQSRMAGDYTRASPGFYDNHSYIHSFPYACPLPSALPVWTRLSSYQSSYHHFTNEETEAQGGK